MAIYYNDKVLEPRSNGTALQRKYYEEREEIKSLFDKFRQKNGTSYLIFTREFNKVWNTTKTSFKPAPPIAIPTNVNIYDNDLGAVQVRYSENPPIRSDRRLLWGSVKKCILTDKMVIEEKDLDFAWFIIKASGCLKNGMLKLVDSKAEYEGKFSDIKKQVEASKIIFDDNISIEKIKALAELVLPASMEINGDTKEELASKLWDAIKTGEANKDSYNYDVLIKANKKLVDSKASGYINENADNGLIHITFEDGRTVDVPKCNCPPRMRDDTLQEKANELNIPTKGFTRQELYSLIRYKEESND